MKKRIISLFMVFVMLLPIFVTEASAMQGIKITTKGQVVDSITFNGVTVNAIYAPRATVKNYSSNATYCCAAFVKKFYSAVYGINVYNLLKNGGGPRANKGSFSVTNDPQVGDILHNTSVNTHWAIVKAVNDNGTVTIIEQNAWYNKDNNVARVGKTVPISGKGIKYYRYSGAQLAEAVKEVFTYDATNVTETSAQLNGYIQVTGRSGHITEHGACIGTCSLKEEMWEAATDYVDHYKNTLSIFYTTSKYGTELYPETTYYYYCYAVIDGETVEGEVKSFTTLGEPEPSEEPAEEPNTDNGDAPRVLVASYPDEGMYNFTPKCAPNNRLDVSGGSYSDKANIQSWEANGEDSQKFELKACGDGYYEIISYRSGKALDMSNGDSTSETNIWQYRRNGTVSQKWKFWQDSEGYYYIVPYLNDNLCMDVDGASSEIGANVWAYEKNYSDAQRWSLTSVAQSSVPAVKDYKDGIIGENDMRVRSGPGTSYKHIGTIPSGSVVQVYPEKQSGNWYYVKYNNLEGYVYKNGITIQ